MMVSGGWDGKCILWRLEEGGSMVKAFDNHRHAVTVCALKQSPGMVVTGSQDGALNVIDMNQMTVVNRKENAHEDIIRQIVETSYGIVSISNDEHVKSFTYDLELISDID